jgi:hypothetical protein
MTYPAFFVSFSKEKNKIESQYLSKMSETFFCRLSVVYHTSELTVYRTSPRKMKCEHSVAKFNEDFSVGFAKEIGS